MRPVIGIPLLVVGAVLLAWGADRTAASARPAAARLGIGVPFLGFAVVGAEPEELVTAVVAARQGHPALALGDAIGANLVVLTLGLGLAAVLGLLRASRASVPPAVLAAAAGGLLALLLRNGLVGRGEGVLLVAAYVGGLAWLVWRSQAGRTRLDRDQPPGSGRALLRLLLGLLALLVGGYLAVRGCTEMVGLLDLTESVIGLTVLALATSAEIPLLVWAAHRHGVGDIALAAGLGAVFGNATLTVGVAALASPLVVGRGSPALDVALLVAVLPLGWAAVAMAGDRLGRLPLRLVGAALLVAYPATLWWLLSG